MDRFESGLRDPQEAKGVALCEQCGGDIYAGEEVIAVLDDDAILHKEGDCLLDYLTSVRNIEVVSIEELLK